MRPLSMLWAGLLLGTTSAMAQPAVEAPSTGPASPDEIIVTGEKSGRTIRHTTTSIAVAKPEKLKEEAILSIQDIYNRTANVSETYGSAGFTIRGIRNTGVSGAGSADTATVYLDGAPLPSEALFGGPTDMWDIAQVEILRGPQSTIQGLNALAGSVVITTRDPGMQWSGDGCVMWTSQDQRTFSGALGGPIVADELAFRLAVEHCADRGLLRNVTRGGYDDRLRSLNLRGKLLWTPAALPDLAGRLGYNRVWRTGGYLYQYTSTARSDYYSDRISLADHPNTDSIVSDIASAEITYRLADGLKLTSATSWNRIHSDATADSDYGPQDLASVHNVYLFLRNMFDARYEQYAYRAGQVAVLGEPRTIGAEVDLHW
ncbi:outer membrane receptor protein involved in Fe transport [Novosphingobium capsulatum]|uniref:Outer membrane receptor protein involved in Fe transport n=1 Tax=Novosphingobium capsulatum TaxID=13688 RepID=A0ABU1MMM4_9SPHN|nr:TonB-dependent receptor plug domain-containing protein [Novosphingobium capsulatum]MDR6511585.1 outer membrane receptor protein involved in Fe transport [Novosphingobium capsulatum]